MMPELNRIYQGDCLEVMRGWPDGCVNCCVTSPPYWGLRDYGVDGQLGLERTPQEYTEKMVAVFREVKRVLRDDGTLWLNLGDTYARDPARGERKPEHCGFDQHAKSGAGTASQHRSLAGMKSKDLVGIPWAVAFALRSDGWYLRQDIIWHKPNPMPESVTDRCTKSHEHIFLLTKSPDYYYDHEAIKERADPEYEGRYKYAFSGSPDGEAICPDDEDGQRTRPEGMREFGGFRNKRSVWTVNTKPYGEAHFATFPEDLIVPCILAGCPEGGAVLDPFMGAGTVAKVALRAGRQFLGCELNPKYIEIANARIDAERRQGKLF